MSLRVHGGQARGRRLVAPAGVRPTQGVVKEALFNALGAGNLEGVRALDLCSGSGALGCEALSRGASHVTFVERGHRQLAAVRQNLDALGYSDRATVVRAEVGRWLEAHEEEVGQVSLVLLDPPYNDPVVTRALELLDRLVRPGALVAVEHGWRHELDALARLRTLRERRYGETCLTLLQAAP